MKKIIFASAFSVFALISSNTIQAQDIAGTAFVYPQKGRVIDPATNHSSKILRETEVNTQAARDFSKKYPNAQDVKWVGSKNVISVYFTLDGFSMRSTYDKKGREEYTLKYYDESKMPASLRHQIKSHYYDYQIDLVTEVKRNSILSYLVKMQDANQFLTVKVLDGEIMEYEKVGKIH